MEYVITLKDGNAQDEIVEEYYFENSTEASEVFDELDAFYSDQADMGYWVDIDRYVPETEIDIELAGLEA